jgi:hypothetical protein
MCVLILSALDEEAKSVLLQNDNNRGNARAATRKTPPTAQTTTRPPTPTPPLWRAHHIRPAPTAADAPHSKAVNRESSIVNRERLFFLFTIYD